MNQTIQTDEIHSLEGDVPLKHFEWQTTSLKERQHATKPVIQLTEASKKTKMYKHVNVKKMKKYTQVGP